MLISGIKRRIPDDQVKLIGSRVCEEIIVYDLDALSPERRLQFLVALEVTTLRPDNKMPADTCRLMDCSIFLFCNLFRFKIFPYAILIYSSISAFIEFNGEN